MKCTNCGAEFAENESFCPECGAPKANTLVTAESIDKNAGAAPVPSIKTAGPAKWLLLLAVGLVVIFIAYKQLSPSVERAEAAARENRLDDALQILDSLKGARADSLRAYVNYQMYVSRLREQIDGAVSNNSDLADFALWMENGENLWAEVVAGAPQLDPAFYSMAEHNHQIQAALADIPYQTETAREYMTTMVDGVEYILDLMKKGLDEAEDRNYRWGDMKARMAGCRQAGEQLAHIIEAYTPFTIELDYENGNVEIGGVNSDEIPYSQNQTYHYFDCLYSASVETYLDAIDDRGKNFSDNDWIYYGNNSLVEYHYLYLDGLLSSMSFYSLFESDMSNALKEQAFLYYIDQFQFA